MALRFGAVASDEVRVTSNAGITGNATWSFCAWVRPTTLNNGGRIFQKGLNPNQRILYLNGTGGNIECDFGRGSGGGGLGLYLSSGNPLSTTNKWYFVACTGDSGASAGNIIHIYVGDLLTIVTEVSYTSKQDGTGTVPGDSGADFIIGNNTNHLSSTVWNGDIANSMFLPGVVLTVGQFRSLQFQMQPIANTKIFHELGFNGTSTQTDWSGNANNGTVTGATQVAHIPLKRLLQAA